MSVNLQSLLTELPETTRNSTSGALDNSKRTRALNRILQDLQDMADWDFTRRTVEFDFIDGVTEYSLQNYIGATCLDNDGDTTIVDFKNGYDMRVVGQSHVPFSGPIDSKEIRYHIQQNRRINEYGIDGDLLIVNYARQTSAQIHDCDSLTSNGTWAATGDATNLTIDDVEFAEGSGALNFDVAAGTSLVLSNTGLASKDLTAFQNKSHWTVKVDLPTITNFSSITLRWGNDLTTNYWEKTVTARADGQDLEVGRNLFAFSWKTATETGSPDPSAVDAVRITIAYSSAVTDTDFRIDDLRIGQSVKMELDYYSLAMVKTSSGSYQLEFNPDEVTMNDRLVGPESRLTVIKGGTYECFKIIGGKSERDRTDSFKEYQAKRTDLMKRCGHRLRRASKVLNFPGRRGRP